MSYTILDKAVIDGIEWVVSRTTEMSYFSPGGKARLGTKVTYSVERSDRAMDAEFNNIPETRQRFRLTSKTEAVKYFKSLTSKAVVVERTGAAALNRIFG